MRTINDFAGNREEFPILGKWDFFNHAGVSPITRGAAEAMRAFAEQAQDAAYMGARWYDRLEVLRQQAAAFVGAHRDEVSFVKNTSEGLATVANGIDWRPGDRVVTTGVEYPANMYPWMDVAQRHGVELVMVAEEAGADGCLRVPMEKILQEAGHPRTRLVTLSHVEFASGMRNDLRRVGQFCRQNGKLFCVDAIQSLGVFGVNVGEMGIDFLSADGHKWLLGPEGAGIFYCRRELLAGMRPLIVGWMNVVNASHFGSYDFTLRRDAGRFECGSHNVVGLLGLQASLELLAELGTAAVAARIKTLTDRLVAGVDKKGYRVLSPRNGEEYSGIVSFAGRPTEHEATAWWLRKERHIEIAVREGRLRASPHFYNTKAQMDRLAEALPKVDA